MAPDALVFDLDGTLWDTSETCAAAWNRVARTLGIVHPAVTAADMRRVAGLAHTEAVRRVFDTLGEEKITRLSELTQLEDNRALAETGGTLYEGVLSLVPELSRERPLFIVSNCQAGYIEVFLATSGLANYFKDFECWGRTGQSKAENLRSLVQRNALGSPWFIGDTEGDRVAARENGIFFVHAAYGFGKVTDSDATVARFDELSTRLAG